MKKICDWWDKKKARQSPYDPVTGILFLNLAVTLELLRRFGEGWPVKFTWIVELIALAMSFIVLCKIVLNAFGKEDFCFMKAFNSEGGKKWVKRVVDAAAGIIITIALWRVVELVHEGNEHWAIEVIGFSLAIVLVLGTNNCPEKWKDRIMSKLRRERHP